MYEATEQVEFAKRAAVSFRDNPKYRSYSDNGIVAGDLLALRWGSDDNCVVVLRMSEDYEITNYQNIIEESYKSLNAESLKNSVLPNGKIVTQKNSDGLWVVFNNKDEESTYDWGLATRLFQLPNKEELNWLYELKTELGIDMSCWYWSSSEFSSSHSWGQYFSDGFQFRYGKTFADYVRTVQYMTDEQLLNEANK